MGGHYGSVTSIDLLEDLNLAFVGFERGYINIFDLEKGESLKVIKELHKGSQVMVLKSCKREKAAAVARKKIENILIFSCDLLGRFYVSHLEEKLFYIEVHS
jgi:hypothetical protein